MLVEHDEEILPGIKSLICPGDTPGSTVYVLDTGDSDIVFTGDACKNRAELVSRAADMTQMPRKIRLTIYGVPGLVATVDC